MSRTRNTILGILLTAIGVFFIWNQAPSQRKAVFTRVNEERGAITFASTTYAVYIADSNAERTQGLSGTPSLQPNEGMLFLFPRSDYHPFWMKEMNFPLDLIWIDASWHVVGVTRDARPDSYPSLFYPPVPIKYVLEIPSI